MPTPLLLLPLLAAVPQTPPNPAPAPAIAWQRTLDDALAVQQATGLPLLVVVNADGEVFCEQFANRTYRDAEFVELTRGYVCVVASPSRHNDRDYDADGNRVECPRFPGCTCSEHQQIEPELFRRWFKNERYAPRHLAVSPAGEVLFDRFLDNSMRTAIDAIGKHRGTPRDLALPAPGDLPAWFARRDAAARRALEERFRRGDAAVRRELLAAAGTAGNAPFDLLRLALRDADDAVVGAAALALAKVGTPAALIDLEDALARVADVQVQAAVVARLRELGRSEPAAARLASHFDSNDDELPPAPWANPWAAPAFDAAARESIEAELDRAEARLKTAPQDAAARLAQATAQLALACWLADAGQKGPELWFADARQSAAKVADPALQPLAHAVAAVADWQLGDATAAWTAVTRALAAGKSAAPPDGWLAGRFLGVLVQGTAQVAYRRAEADATASLRAEVQRVRGTLRLLQERGAGDEPALLAGIGLLEFAGLRARAAAALAQLVQRFPASPAVHERWRNRLLVDRGAAAMQAAVAAWADGQPDAAAAAWFAGYAALVAGEQQTRDQRPAAAIAAYRAAVDRFAASAAANADYADSAHHFAVLALAGGAELKAQTADGLEGAAADLLRAAGLRAASLDESDGLQRKPRAIAGRVHRALVAAGKAELAAQLQPLLP